MIANKKDQSGIALIMVLGVLAVLLILGVTFAFNMRLEQRAARNYLDYVLADHFAKAGINMAAALLLEQRGDGYYHDGIIGGIGAEVFVERDGVTLGSYTIESIEDESGKVNLNHAGNLSDSGSHGANEGWTAYEISLEDVFENSALTLGAGDAAVLSGRIVRYRHGGVDTPGTSSFNTGVDDDGIDNDGSGEAGDADIDPFWYTPWKPRLGSAHRSFIAASQLYTVHADFSDFWEDDWPEFDRLFTVHSRAGNPALNVNAVEDPQVLYDLMSGTLPADAVAQKAVNIFDYRDANDWITEFTPDGAAETYYGVESVLINEVLAYSYWDDDELDYENDNPLDPPPPHVIPDVARNTRFMVGIWFTIDGDPDEYSVNVWGADPTLPPLTYPPPFSSPVYRMVESSAAGEIFISTTIAHNAVDPGQEVKITITHVRIICAEFIELVNIGGEPVDIADWEIEILPGNRRVITTNSVEILPGDYVILTNNAAFFNAMFPGVPVPVIDVAGWDDGLHPDPADWTGGKLSGDGAFDVRIFDSEGNFTELSINSANTSRPGPSGTIGVSMEKDDPAVRNSWVPNHDGRSTPGADNSRVIGGIGEDILVDLRAGDHPPLVGNKHFASVGELVRTEDWGGGGVKYAGVRSHENHWTGIGDDFFREAADRLIGGYYIRVDGGSTGDDIRIPLNHRRMNYLVYGYEDDEGFLLEEGTQYTIDEEGGIDIPGPAYDYVLLIPDSIAGRINVNTAASAVISGLPGFNLARAQAVRAAAPFLSMGDFIDSLEAITGGDAKRYFAPIANLVTVNSDVFTAVVEGRTYGPAGTVAASKRIRAVIDRSGGDARIISWQVLE